MRNTYKEFHDNRYAEIPQETKDKAKEIILDYLGASGLFVVKDAYYRLGYHWIHNEKFGHFDFGMRVRNILRTHGILDEQFKSGNLDDYYCALIEYATGLRE